ncbi:hypothetical protein BN1058_01078 [Paraliobacillus sp. PM-2]|uniref:YetF domain-containing protein n=1 Tax=Paraliobacillus sp. PM-2 TaxID=1462524 RepID=UPI00061BBD66|nr:DUF421 domain-containing protein [Paraliobacillus sp. PM-2]CQR46803.1 hypothetical protein BN1058_01078 [Paraliobacillus sp. PM-2]
MNYIEITLRIVLAFFVLLILTRLMGRKEISQLTFFNFVSSIAIGTIAGSLTIDPQLSLGHGIYVLVGWAILTIILGYIDIKSKSARDVIEGQPVIVIKNGQVMEQTMKKIRLDINTLNAKLRQKNVFSIKDVDYAILETDGKISVMKKEIKQPVSKKDLHVSNEKNLYSIPTEVITDGKINHQNLSKLNLNEEWLHQQLKVQGIKSISDVFYAEIQKDGSIYIDKRIDK